MILKLCGMELNISKHQTFTHIHYLSQPSIPRPQTPSKAKVQRRRELAGIKVDGEEEETLYKKEVPPHLVSLM